jgi:hypothetical protein
MKSKPLTRRRRLVPSPAVEVLESRIAPATLASLSSGSITVSGDQGGASEVETLTFTIITTSGPELHISDATHAITAGSGFTQNGTNDVFIALSSLTANLTVNSGAGADTLAFSSDLSLPGDATLTSDAVTFNNSISIATGKTLSVNAGATIGLPNTGSDLTASGTGVISLTTKQDIKFASGSSVTTVNGNLTLSANAAGTTTGNFVGVDVNAGVVQATGTGLVVITGKGGNDAGGFQYGVEVRNGGSILGGTSGLSEIRGTGGNTSGHGNRGVLVTGSSSRINSNGGALLVEGTGGGTGGSVGNIGVDLDTFGVISNLGTGAAATVTVRGTGGNLSGSSGGGGANHGVALHFNTSITSSGGAVVVEGTGGGTLASSYNEGVFVYNGASITSAGTGTGATVTISGTGGNAGGTGTFNYGVGVDGTGSIISSSGGAIDLTAIGSATSEAVAFENAGSMSSGLNAAITITADSLNLVSPGTINSGTGLTSILTRTAGTFINLGSAGGPTAGTLELSDAELNLMTGGTIQIGKSNSGAITVSSAISHPNNLSLTTGAGVTFNNAVTMAVNKNLTVLANGTSAGISLATTNSDLAASGTGAISLTTLQGIKFVSGASVTTVNGNLTLSANALGTTTGNFVGVDVDAALVQATGTGVVSVTGKGGNDSGGNQRGVNIRNGGDIIGGTSGTTTVSGTGGPSGNGNIGVGLSGSGSTIGSGGAHVQVTGQGGSGTGSISGYGIHMDPSAQITAGGMGNVTVTGTGGSDAVAGNYLMGVVIANGSVIDSSGGNVSVTGTGGTGTTNEFAGIFSNATITAGGAGSVTVIGNGGTVSGSTNTTTIGVDLRFTALITSSGGNVSVTGTGGNGNGASSGENAGVRIFGDSVITAGGTGTVSVTGTGTSGSGVGHEGVYVSGNNQNSNLARIGAANGATTVTATSGGSSFHALAVGTNNNGRITTGTNNAITITADSINFGGSATISSGTGPTTITTRTVGTLINLGGADALSGSPLTLGLTDAELDKVTAGTLTIGDSSSGAISVSAAMTHANNFTLATGSGATFSQAVTLTSGKSLNVNAGPGTIILATAGVLTTSGTGAISLAGTDVTGSGNINIGGGLTLTNTGTASTLSGVISGGALTKLGTGTLTLTAANTYSGGSTISQGTIQFGNYLALGSGAVVLNDSNTGTSNTALLAAAVMNSGATGAGSGGSFANVISVANAGSGSATIGTAAFTANDASGNNSTDFSGDIVLAKSATLAGGNTAQTNFLGRISGSGAVLTVMGGQLSVLSGINSFSANVSVVGSGTILGAAGGSAIPDFDNVNVGTGAIFQIYADEATNALSGSGTVKSQGNHTLTLDSNDGIGTFAGSLQDGTGVLSLIISAGSSGLAGSQTLSGTNTYTGDTTVTAGGTLALGASNTLPATGVHLPASSNLQLGGFSQTFASLDLNGGFIGGTGTLTSLGNLTLNGGTINAKLAGNINVTANTGSTTLGNPGNSFTGLVTILDTLIVASNGALGNLANAVVIEDSGTLIITGTFSTARHLTANGSAPTLFVQPTKTLTLNGLIDGTGVPQKDGLGKLLFGSTVTGNIALTAGTPATTFGHETVSLTGTGSVIISLVSDGAGGTRIATVELADTTAATILTINGSGVARTTIDKIISLDPNDEIGTIKLGPTVVVGNGLDDGIADIDIRGKVGRLLFNDINSYTLFELGKGLPYNFAPDDTTPDTYNSHPDITLRNVGGPGVIIDVTGNGIAGEQPGSLGGGGLGKVVVSYWPDAGTIKTTQSIGSFTLTHGDCHVVFEVDAFHNGVLTTAGVGSVSVPRGAWASTGGVVEGEITTMTTGQFLAGATITAGKITTFTVFGDFQGSVSSTGAMKNITVNGRFMGSLQAASIGKITAEYFDGTDLTNSDPYGSDSSRHDITTTDGAIGLLTAKPHDLDTFGIKNYEITVAAKFGGFSVIDKTAPGSFVGIDHVTLKAGSIGTTTVTLIAPVGAKAIQNSVFESNGALGAITTTHSVTTSMFAAATNIAQVTVKGSLTLSKILAGTFLGDDAALGGVDDAADVFNKSYKITGVKVVGAFSTSTIAVGVDSVDGIYGNGDDVLATLGLAPIGLTKSIGALNFGAGSGTAGAALSGAHSYAIEAASLKTLLVSGIAVSILPGVLPKYLDLGTAGEDSDDVRLRILV